MDPIRIEADGTAIFTTDQIDEFGFPNESDYPKYYVIESPPKMMMSYVHEQQTQYRKIHRYDRDSRFRSHLRNLVGDTKSKIDPSFLIICRGYMLMQKGVNRYEGCRSVIRHFKKPSYYCLIPSMIIIMGMKPLLTFNGNLDLILRKVFIHYKAFEGEFFRNQQSKKYFPNMKYLALTLLELYGVLNDGIPKLRTSRKLKSMEKKFKIINDLLLINKT